MTSSLKFNSFPRNPYLLRLYRNCHFEPGPGPGPSRARTRVAVFWDLENKPPKSIPPYEAVLKLRTTASSFGLVKYTVAYANRHAFRYVPKVVREERRERSALNQLENKGLIRPVESYLCGVCGRRFFNNERLVNHFKQIHEREHQKRVNQIESARGKRRLKLVGRYAMKMEKYKKAVRGVLTPKVGYGLGDELKRAGVWVRTVLDKPQAADVALRDHIVDMMDKRGAECLVLVSDDSGFVDVLEEAKLRCLKTVVMGDVNDGALKRVADACFSWPEILMGKAKKEAGSVVGRWRDRDVLKRLEWSYNPEKEKRLYGVVDESVNPSDDSENEDVDSIIGRHDDDDFVDFMRKEDTGHWWELDSDLRPGLGSCWNSPSGASLKVEPGELPENTAITHVETREINFSGPLEFIEAEKLPQKIKP